MYHGITTPLKIFISVFGKARFLLELLSNDDNIKALIITFRSQLAEDLFFDRRTGVTKRFPAELRAVAQRKLQYLNVATRLDDLKAPPGNRLEALKGSHKGFYSIRINDQWRIVFRWRDGAYEVQIVD